MVYISFSKNGSVRRGVRVCSCLCSASGFWFFPLPLLSTALTPTPGFLHRGGACWHPWRPQPGGVMGPSLDLMGGWTEPSQWAPLLTVNPATQPNGKVLLLSQPCVLKPEQQPWSSATKARRPRASDPGVSDTGWADAPVPVLSPAWSLGSSLRSSFVHSDCHGAASVVTKVNGAESI